MQLRGKLERTLTAQGILYGCSVQGPFTAVDESLDSLSEERRDVGRLDINLYQEFSYPVAARLNEMGIPFAFFTAYDDNTLPDAFVGRPIIPKNDRRDDIVAKVKGLLRA
ncbi:response regulator [Marivivens sp. JLT3646]|uniref:response regulator n=1 Tax=Marivivens sp. JLT3646 TaxID=1920883 RepID=UPI0012ECA7CB|nr:response regulator [Marivivens sp. JLT3646]